jgi:HlyD family secretion protein
LSAPEVTVEVDEIYAAEIRAGMTARVAIPAEPQDIAARVDYIEPNVDPATGARNVRLLLANAPSDAPSGLTVTVNLLIETRDRALSIPRSAILTRGGRHLVRVMGADGKVRETQVRFVDWPAETVIVTAGLKAKDRILTNPDQAQVGDQVEPAK